MNRILTSANKKMSLGSAAALLSGASILGILLGILRTKLINANFNSFSSDAYFAAFKIPDFIYFTLASGALGVAFLPILSDKLLKNKQEAWQVASYVLNALAIVAFLASVLIMIFAYPLMRLVADGFTPEQLQLSVAIMRIVSINIFLFSISTVLTTVQQSVGRFFFFAVAPLFYNVAIVASIYIFGDRIGIVGLGLGVAIGAILQLIVASFGMIGLKFKYSFKIDFKDKGFLEVIKILPARSIDQGVDYINAIVETKFASRLAIGTVTNYENALLLHAAPIMLIGNSVATAAFPRLTNRLSQGRVDLFRKEFLRVLQTIIWLALPVVIVAYFSREYLARIIFARSNREIALIFGFLCIAVFFRILYSIISRYFYAYKDTKTPLFVSLFVITLNIFLAYTLSKPGAYGVVGLALAQGIVAITEILILTSIMIKRDHKLFNKVFIYTVLKIFLAGFFTAVTAYVVVKLIPLAQSDTGLQLIAKVSIVTGSAFAVQIIASYILRLQEAKIVVKKVWQLMLRPMRIQ